MYGPSPMNFIYDVDRASSALRNGTSSLGRWLEVPDGSAKSRVFDDFRGSERHLPKKEKKKKKKKKRKKARLYVLSIDTSERKITSSM